jgi:HEAT repeat protein
MMIIILAFLSCLDPQDDVTRARALVERMDADDIREREAAVRELTTLAPTSAEVEQFLEKASREGSAEVQGRLVAVLEERQLRRQAARFVPDPDAFIARLRSPDWNVRFFAFQRIQRLGAEGAVFAAEYLVAGDPSIQPALQMVALSRDPRYIPKVRPFLKDPKQRHSALDALSHLGDPGIREELHQILGNPQRASSTAVEQLGRLRHPDDIAFFDRLIRGDQRELAEASLRVLRGWPQAKKQLSDSIFGRVREGSGLAILLALDLRDARLLGEIKDLPESPEALFARAVLGDASAVPHLLRMAKYGPSVRLGWWGLGVLKARTADEQVLAGRFPAPGPAADFKRALGDLLEEYEILGGQGTHYFQKRYSVSFERRGALPVLLWSLGEMGGTEAERVVRGAVQESDESARYAACQALGRMRSSAAVPDLVRCLDDALAFRPPEPVPEPPQEGGDSMGAFSAVSQPRGGQGWAEVRQAAVAALERIAGERFEGTTDEKVGAWKAWSTHRGGK